jgi:hypothetical protein
MYSEYYVTFILRLNVLWSVGNDHSMVLTPKIEHYHLCR